MGNIEGLPGINVAELERAAQAYKRQKLKRVAVGLAVQLHCNDAILDDLAVIRSAKAILEWLDRDEEPNGHDTVMTKERMREHDSY
jgi:hypothetical protein